MINKLLKFLFPPITIGITAFFFFLFFLAEGLKNAIDNTFLFFVVFMLPFDLIAGLVKWVIGVFAKETNFNNSYSMCNSKEPIPKSESNSKKTTIKPKNNKALEDYASLCIASCEFDKEQNMSDSTTNGNVRYNDIRFDDLEDDLELRQIISKSKLDTVSNTIVNVYEQIGVRIIIDGAICTKPYIVLKLVPMNGARIDTIIMFQNNVEYAIKMKTVMNVMYKKGYIGVILPIQYFIKNSNEEG